MNKQDERVINAISLIIADHIKNGGNLKYDGRNIGTLLFEHSTIYSGYTSEAALVQRFSSSEKWTKEHIYPRQLVGEKLIQDFKTLGRVDKKLLKEKIKQYTLVHHVTKKENDLLKQYQDRANFKNPEIAYKKAKISKLVPWKKGHRIIHLPQIYPHLQPFLTSSDE